jgi:hypothetical protein
MESSCSPSAAESLDQMTTFCYLMIEEFLIKKNMRNTLTSFREEWETRPDDVVSNLSWFNISLKLHLPDLLKKEQDKNVTANKSIVEHLTTTLIESSSTRMRVEPEVLITGLASLPRNKSTIVLPLPPLIINSPNGTKSAPGSLSLSSLSSPIGGHGSGRGQEDNFNLLQNETKLEQHMLKKHQKKSQIISQKYPSHHSPIRQQQQQQQHRVSQQQQSSPKNNNLLSYHPNNILKPSTENWIPEIVRFRSIHRDLITLESNLQSTIIMETELNRELRSLQINQLEKAHLEEELGVKKKMTCGCCLQLYSHINLPMMIPIKAIIDIRKKWSGGERGWWSVDDERIEHMPRCYEGIRICSFCSQFFHHQESYRPSFDQINKEQQLKQRNEMKRVEKEYWDPLKVMEQDREKMELTGSGFDTHEIKGMTSISYE